MTTELFIKIVSAVITIVISLVTAYVIPYLKAKIGTDGMDKLYWYVDMAVRCADQIFTPEQCEQKKAYVFAYILSVVNNKLHINLDEADIDIIIEGAVNQIHKGE